MSAQKRNLVVIGNGMVGHRFVEAMIAGLGTRRHRSGGSDAAGADDTGDAAQAWNITIIGEEPRLAYDRVNLFKFFDGKAAEELALVEPGRYEAAGITVHLGDPVQKIDRAARVVTSATGRVFAYDALVLATGSSPFVPPVAGHRAKGVFVYRTIEDLETIRAYGWHARTGVVIGGGLLGLEAAGALRKLGVETHVVELAPRLMSLQVDEAGGRVLRRRIEDLGVAVHTEKSTKEIVLDGDGVARRLRFEDGEEIAADMVVFSAGIRPRDELARESGLAVGERGGIVIDERCRTSDPDIFAIGECALFGGRIYGLVAPGYRMAETAAAILCDGDARITAFDMSTTLKLLGIDVASFGDAFARTPGARVLSVLDNVGDVYKKLVVSEDKKLLLGGMLVGDSTGYATLLQMVQNKVALPPHPEDLILKASGDAGSGSRAPAGFGVGSLPDAATICSCHNIDKGSIRRAITDQGLNSTPQIKKCTRAGTGCGSCVPLLTDILKIELAKAGVAVSNALCEHFAHSRQDLFHLVKLHQIRSFDELIARHGSGRGCEICKPAVASILASTWNENVLDDKHVGLQDTNDRFLANLQRDGTYSVVPRVPGGEITPDQLIALGQVAKRYGLYTKITGGQRVDLFGARVEQLPGVWRDLIAAGFESGHAYGKALRTVKSCVGSTWCRYGVQDSVGMAIRLENRYKGLRSPHKLKGAASGCARECAEAQGKDFGVIATDKGYNLYVCGNGGMKPQHAQLLAADLDEDKVVRYLDRFLMFYVRTADRLQRTASWFNGLEGGIEYLRKVVIEDSLGICAELEADMQRIVDTYECEWKAAINDPVKLRRFRPFVNSDAADPSVVFVSERDQHRPARWNEKAHVLPHAGPHIGNGGHAGLAEKDGP